MPPPTAALTRNGNVGGYFCPSRLNHRNCGQVCPQTESVLLNAWKGKNPPPLVPNVPGQGSRRGLCWRHSAAVFSYKKTPEMDNICPFPAF